MTNRILSKLKIGTKHILGRCVYLCTYFTNKTNKVWKSFADIFVANNKQTSPLVVATGHWKILIVSLFLFLCIYYSLGLLIGAKIDNKLNVEIRNTSAQGYQTLNALTHTLKTQIDDNTWTPGLPLIFPQSISDNLINFQLGTKESLRYFVSRLARIYDNKKLSKAAKLLNYPPDVWLFTQTQDEKFSPGSVKQYRKALALIKEASETQQKQSEYAQKELLHILRATQHLITREIDQLTNHVQEHHSDFIDFKADNIFYKTSGTLYTLHYLLSAVAKDYQAEILKTEQYENITAILKLLTQALDIKPTFIKNADTNNTFSANHLLYQAYYLSQVKNKLSEIYHKNMTVQQEIKK